jgi:hypothetical protein
MLHTAISLLLLQAPVATQSPAPPKAMAAPKSPAPARSIGNSISGSASWDVTGPKGGFAGINRIELVDGGCALFENWASGGGGYTGRSLNSVDGDGRWRQSWVDSSGGRLELVGGLVDGKMVMEGDSPPAKPGEPNVKNRITWTPQADGGVRQVWEASSDGGKSYTIAFDGLYHRVATASQRPATSPRAAEPSASAAATNPSAAITSPPTAVTNSPAATGATSKGTEATTVLQALAGGWIGTGTIQKKDAHVELELETVLDGKHYRLAWTNSGGKDGRELFEGFAIYEQQPDGTLAATWWDSQGARKPSPRRPIEVAHRALGRAAADRLPPARHRRTRGHRQRQATRRQLERVRADAAEAQVSGAEAEAVAAEAGGDLRR